VVKQFDPSVTDISAGFFN